MSGDVRAPESGDILRGIIRWCRQEDVAATRTRLMKLMYLADLHFARNHGGATATGWTWKLDAFGPLATECYRLFDTGVKDGWLRHHELSGVEGRDPATHVYSLPAEAVVEDLVGLGRVKTWIKDYGDSTAALLSFVYAETEPMLAARPGDELDFSTALPPPSWIPAVPLSAKAMKRLKEVSARMASRPRQSPLSECPLDATYFAGLPAEEAIGPAEFVLVFDED